MTQTHNNAVRPPCISPCGLFYIDCTTWLVQHTMHTHNANTHNTPPSQCTAVCQICAAQIRSACGSALKVILSSRIECDGSCLVSFQLLENQIPTRAFSRRAIADLPVEGRDWRPVCLAAALLLPACAGHVAAACFCVRVLPSPSIHDIRQSAFRCPSAGGLWEWARCKRDHASSCCRCSPLCAALACPRVSSAPC